MDEGAHQYLEEYPNISPPTMTLGHKNYFEPKTIKNHKFGKNSTFPPTGLKIRCQFPLLYQERATPGDNYDLRDLTA